LTLLGQFFKIVKYSVEFLMVFKTHSIFKEIESPSSLIPFPSLKKGKVLFASAEIFPLCPWSELADQSSGLSEKLYQSGIEIQVIQPLYRETVQSGLVFEDLRLPFKVTLGKDIFEGKFLKTKLPTGVVAILVDQPSLFNRPGMYGSNTGLYADNLDRFSFFCHAVLTYLRLSDFKAELIHCNDWATGLIPALLKCVFKNEETYSSLKTVFSIHHLAQQGNFDGSLLPRTGLPWSSYNLHEMEFWGQVSFIKGGIVFADSVVIDSEPYREKMLIPEWGFGLHGALEKRIETVWGIKIGADFEKWNPETDEALTHKYSQKTSAKKKENKKEWIRAFEMQCSETTPLVFCIGSLSTYRGDSFFHSILDVLLQLDASFVWIGETDPEFIALFEKYQEKSDKRWLCLSRSDETLLRRALAAADLLVIPNFFEPATLLQWYSLRYGAIPIVSKIASFADVVSSYDRKTGQGNAFLFEDHHSTSLLGKIISVLNLFRDEKVKHRLLLNAMRVSLDWKNTVAKYHDLYQYVKIK
jgi:starch synthase